MDNTRSSSIIISVVSCRLRWIVFVGGVGSAVRGEGRCGKGAKKKCGFSGCENKHTLQLWMLFVAHVSCACNRIRLLPRIKRDDLEYILVSATTGMFGTIAEL